MGALVHTAKIGIVQKQQPLREAHIEGFPAPIRFEVHGGYASFYKTQAAEPRPVTIDHFVAALAG